MALDVTAIDLLGVGAGILILAVGAFVFIAQPSSWRHRTFFALAVADGLSTILFRLRRMSGDPADVGLYIALFWYYNIAFVTLLALFGLTFPKPVGGRVARRVLPAATLAVGLLALVTYARRHDLFYALRTAADGRVATPNGPLGNLVEVALMAATILIALRLVHLHFREASPSHRRQGAFVLGGVVVNVAPYATQGIALLMQDPLELLRPHRADVTIGLWMYVLTTVSLVASGVLLARDRAPARRTERRIVALALAAVLAIALVTYLVPRPSVATLLRMLAFVTYPSLLAYAIVRYEVFDIDRRMRRAATVTIAAGLLAGIFVIGQNALEEILQETLLLGVPSAWAASSVAAIATAILSVPVTRVSRIAARKVVPELAGDALHARKLEIYRHGVAGALADGIVSGKESRTLTALRESLGITAEEHEAIWLAVQAEAGPATPAAAAPTAL